MIRSMTAFASCEGQVGNYSLTWEIRAVNHRHLDVSPRLSESFRSIESELRKSVANHLKRGKVDCNLFFRKDDQAESRVEVNQARLEELLKATRLIEEKMGTAQPMSALDLLRWPGMQLETTEDMAPVHVKAMLLLNEGLLQLVETREREGAQIALMIEDRCRQVDQQVLLAKERLPEIKRLLREKLEQKINDLLEEPEQARLEQELVYFLQKMDVEEELDRLETHVKEVRRLLSQADPVGRRLDFLMQELNREANTLGSKSMDVQTTNISVELKVLIEQMREQIQNIE